jgi:hypothetical protein
MSGFAAIDSANARRVPSSRMAVPVRLYVLRYENKDIHNRERDHVQPICRHTKYEHACMPCTYIYLHSGAQRNSTYHAQTCPTTMYSCEQAMYYTHLSVWSVELWASAAAMCCAPSSPMELSPRLYAHMCVRRAIQHTCVAHDARSRTHNRERPMHTCIPKYQIQTRVHALHVYLPSFQCTMQ